MILHLTKDKIRECLTSSEIKMAEFGLEREGLRITSDAKLALTSHPKIFGDKLKNPHITTDFSESQVEMVTPIFKTTIGAHDFLKFLTDTVITSINDDEYLWNQSLPCILPESNEIPIAKYGTDKKSEESYNYRVALAKKYGTKKQLISGIHYNFSFDEIIIEKLYEQDNFGLDYKNFKNQIYLKILRNYLRYKWLIIYLTGCSISVHETFTQDCKMLMNEHINDEYMSSEGTSYRNGSCGYKNQIKLYPRYDSVENFVSDINDYVDKGYLSEAKELYTQVRLKSKDPDNFLESLEKEGILYIELRTVDINIFDECGISLIDMDFLHVFMIYLLIKEESDYPKWQEESIINEDLSAEKAFVEDMRLLKDGNEISLNKWANEVIEEIIELNNYLKLGFDEVLDVMKERINDSDKTYSKKLLKMVEDRGFINSQTELSKKYKKNSQKRIKEGYPEFKEYTDKILL